MAINRRFDDGLSEFSADSVGVASAVLDLPRGFDDFVPEGAFCPLDYSDCSQSHDFERDIQRRLLETPGLHFSSLVIHRTDSGICVQGVLETSDAELDVGKVVRDVSGVENVVNQVLVRHCDAPLALEC